MSGLSAFTGVPVIDIAGLRSDDPAKGQRWSSNSAGPAATSASAT
jgi:hypothetical protein